MAEPKFQARVLVLFSLVALLLAGVGIYGAVASSVLERRFEIGVRMALGADRTSAVRLVLRRTMLLTLIGARPRRVTGADRHAEEAALQRDANRHAHVRDRCGACGASEKP